MGEHTGGYYPPGNGNPKLLQFSFQLFQKVLTFKTFAALLFKCDHVNTAPLCKRASIGRVAFGQQQKKDMFCTCATKSCTRFEENPSVKWKWRYDGVDEECLDEARIFSMKERARVCFVP